MVEEEQRRGGIADASSWRIAGATNRGNPLVLVVLRRALGIADDMSGVAWKQHVRAERHTPRVVSEENLEIVRRMYEQASERPEALYEILAEDVYWDASAVAQLELGIVQGRDAVMEFFRRWVGAFEPWGYETEELLDLGDCVVARVHQWGRGKASGVAVDQRFWQVWTFRDGKAIRTTHHREKTEAVEAAGLTQ